MNNVLMYDCKRNIHNFLARFACNEDTRIKYRPPRGRNKRLSSCFGLTRCITNSCTHTHTHTRGYWHIDIYFHARIIYSFQGYISKRFCATISR